ncbi:MAG TPA: cyclic nucleotide-binding domain-containing protein [Thermodesulfobacteriota bacterium]|nr:cyclic nucleotide-binding domain-containing protein [Thermodesulfobacteriota bacterium]
MQKLEPILAENPLFRGLDQRHLQTIVGCASDVQFNAGELILRAGEEAGQLYIILNGKVELETLMTSEQEPTTVQTIGEGDVLGWSWLFPPYRWHFDARAVVPTQAIALDGKYLRSKCDEDHDFGYELLKRFAHIVVQRLEAMRSQLPDKYAVHF